MDRRHLAGYTGILNAETIGGRMIEASAAERPAVDLYGEGWVDALVRLYDARLGLPITTAATAAASSCSARTGLPASAAGAGGAGPQHPRRSSVQITFHEDKDPAQHMPPGGFRLAIVNAWNLQAGLAGRDMLRPHFLAKAA